MASACWIVAIVSDDGALIHPLEAFLLALCTGEYELGLIKYIFAGTLRKEEHVISDLVERSLQKLARYIDWKERSSMPMSRYDPEVFLYDPAPDAWKSDRRFSTPGEMVLILTHKCNFRCIYCFNSSGNVNREIEMNTGEWLNAIDQANDLGVVKCTLSGGEPMLHPGFPQILEAIRNRDMLAYICTNGSLLDESSIRQFAELGLPCIQISLDAASSRIHDRLSATSGTFFGIVDAIKSLVRSGIEVYIKSVITPVNIDEVGPLIDLCADLGVRRLVLDRFDLSNTGRGGPELFVSPDRELEIAQMVAHKQDADGMMSITAVTGPRRWSGRGDIITCGALRRSMNILPNGDVSVCEKVLGVPELTMGNIRNESLSDIWISPKVRNILALPLNRIGEACKSCENFADCGTGCFALSLSVAGNPYATDPRCWQASYANNPFLRERGGAHG